MHPHSSTPLLQLQQLHLYCSSSRRRATNQQASAVVVIVEVLPVVGVHQQYHGVTQKWFSKYINTFNHHPQQ
jgi:hypothetical protein